MTQIILDSLEQMSSIDLNTILLNNAMAIVMALFIMFTYWLTYSGTAYSRKYNISVGMITLITTLIMSVISNNVALSLGLVGALSIIRFRTAVKDMRDATFVFWAIAVGICCGVSQYILPTISSVVLFLFLLLWRQVGPEGKLLLVVRTDMGTQNRVEAVVEEHFKRAAHRKMKNATPEMCELVYEVRQKSLEKANERAQVDIVQQLFAINGVRNVNLVEQTDDISR